MLLALILAASPVTEAANDYSDLDYEACVSKLEKARASAKERPAAELLLGLCHFALGHEQLARTFVESALRRDPNVRVPASASPKERALIDELRRAAASAVSATPRKPASREREREREREKAPVVTPSDAPTVVAVEPPPATTPVEPPPPLPLPEVVKNPEAVSPPAPAKPTWVPLVTGGLAVAATGVGIGFGVSARGLETRGRDEPVQLTAAALGAEAQTHATVANVAFAVAGTAALGALISWLVIR